MQSADTAMYHVKESGKNNYQYFTKAMTEAAQARAQLEKDLRTAINNNEFELYYQPKVTMDPICIVGCEALIRWDHPVHGFISPDVFIPVAEEIGVIVEIGEWVLIEAAMQVAAWRDEGLSGFSMAINLSPVQFKDGMLARKIQNCIDIAGIEKEMLEFEITENVLMSNVQESTEGLFTLKKLGVSLAIDDFGTGYSSLSYLKTFDIDILKIDRSFVNDIHTETDSAEIITAVISLAHNLGLKIVAEGVETVEQLAFLNELNCDIYQGYFFSKPLPADAFFEYAKEKNRL